MIDIGNTLRSARTRQGLELQDCELETRIRARYLGALEDERFEILPEPAYARGFLRSYATFLGLDGRVLVEEFDDRFGGPREILEAPTPPRKMPRGRRIPLPSASARRRGTRRRKSAIAWLLIGAVGTAVLALWAGAAWYDHPAPLTAPGGSSGHVPTASGMATTPAISSTPIGGAVHAVLVVRLVGSPGTGSRVTVRTGGAIGRIAFDGLIPAGISRNFSSSHALWVRMSATTGVEFYVDGRPAEIPGGVTQVLVAADGTVRGD